MVGFANVQRVKRDEHALLTAEKQITKYRSARIIDTCDLAINNSVLDAQVFSDPLCEILEVAERLSIARDEVALAVVDVGEGANAVDL